MISKQDIYNLFPLQIPISENGIFWNGKPDKWSNLPKYNLYLSQKFGTNLMDYKQFSMAGHNGLDIAGYRAPIVLPIKMWITEAANEDKGGYGTYVRGETETRTLNGDKVKVEIVLGHMIEGSIPLKTGHWYEKGTFAGVMGSTGFSSGSHLHIGPRPWINVDSANWKLFEPNAYAGYIDPEPFMPHIVWDYRELTNNAYKPMSNNAEQFIKQNDLKLIRNKDTGEVGWLYGGKIRTAKTDDRMTLMNMSYLHRTQGGVTIDNKLWEELPKANF